MPPGKGGLRGVMHQILKEAQQLDANKQTPLLKTIIQLISFE